MNDLSRSLIAGVVLLVLAGSGYLWWQERQERQERQAAELTPLIAPNTSALEAVTPAPAPIHHAIEAITPPIEAPLPPLTDSGSEVSDALVDLLGREQVLSFVDATGFAQRVVATVDNLARGHAASRLWPVHPAPGRFQVVERDGATYIADANRDRYKAFVRFASAVDTDAAVALYLRMYPLLQKAYEELGYPGKYFNNRLIEVIDQLLATPELLKPVQLTLVEVKGQGETPRPWVRYEYADPALEARPAGQKILLRMGPGNAGPLKAKLRQFRQRVASSGVTG
ncbi:MAG: hypothetical protein AW10_02027 [Candidatus Accumulibacter appositus]|uniref:DUF3014 domain-containing protein n=1 Tax=Candidatus Accumulibacter appositus TaxID=1454003 RepID=A0A011QMH5_9PROT|nr:DUF3014 domain-containing protein [Accumulibacter sp.]EXI80059.1 MAG: hypothetical protein AW10_02027 [Candidatus Accumulibacter appositus]HRF06183.1 DUF3014 domain-containing protein [Accumulibacter sp.]